MLMVNMSAPIARCRCSISGHLSTRSLGLSQYRRMTPNSSWADLMVSSGLYQASALQIEEELWRWPEALSRAEDAISVLYLQTPTSSGLHSPSFIPSDAPFSCVDSAQMHRLSRRPTKFCLRICSTLGLRPPHPSRPLPGH